MSMTRTLRVVFLTTSLVAGAAGSAAPASTSSPDPCNLLAARDIDATQRSALTDRKGSEHTVKRLHYSQCIFITRDVVRSISLTLIRGAAAPEGDDAVRSYWTDTFGPRQRLDRKNPPREVANVGDAAFWTSDPQAGVLYVLTRNVIMRVSVGGLSDDDERLRRSRVLAQAAVRRLRGG